METRNSVLTGRSGELMKMAILRMQETKIMDRAGMSFRISEMRQNGPILCKRTPRGTKLECPLESVRVFGNDAERTLHANRGRPDALEQNKT
jgi:hypothetical protein